MAARVTNRLLRFVNQLAPKGFLADRNGVTAVEFAMISVPFIGLIGAIFETGTVYFRSAQLQMATEMASRAVLTHSTAADLTYQQFVDQYLCTWQASGVVKSGTLSTMFDCSQLMVDISSPSSWTSASTGDAFTAAPRSTTITMPAAGKIAIVRVAYPTSVVMGVLGGSTLAGGSGFSQVRSGQTQNSGTWSYIIMGIAAFRVEP